MRYKLYALGPDNSGTYPECWGSQATSDGRLIAEASRLAELVEAADRLPHENWNVHDTRRCECLTPEEFWRRPTVAALRKRSRVSPE